MHLDYAVMSDRKGRKTDAAIKMAIRDRYRARALSGLLASRVPVQPGRSLALEW